MCPAQNAGKLKHVSIAQLAFFDTLQILYCADKIICKRRKALLEIYGEWSLVSFCVFACYDWLLDIFIKMFNGISFSKFQLLFAKHLRHISQLPILG